MRERLQQPGAQQRYNHRIATVEPVFASLEEAMGFRRACSRHADTIVAENGKIKLLREALDTVVASKAFSKD